MACDYIAATQGESQLWALMDAFHSAGAGTPDDLQDGVLLSVLGIDSRELAQAAARRILRTYDKDDAPDVPVGPPASTPPDLPAT